MSLQAVARAPSALGRACKPRGGQWWGCWLRGDLPKWGFDNADAAARAPPPAVPVARPAGRQTAALAPHAACCRRAQPSAPAAAPRRCTPDGAQTNRKRRSARDRAVPPHLVLCRVVRQVVDIEVAVVGRRRAAAAGAVCGRVHNGGRERSPTSRLRTAKRCASARAQLRWRCALHATVPPGPRTAPDLAPSARSARVGVMRPRWARGRTGQHAAGRTGDRCRARPPGARVHAN